MRKQLGKSSVIAARVATKHYHEKIRPFGADIKSQEGKETYHSTMIIMAGADLFKAFNGDFEKFNNQLDMLVNVVKAQAKENQKK